MSGDKIPIKENHFFFLLERAMGKRSTGQNYADSWNNKAAKESEKQIGKKVKVSLLEVSAQSIVLLGRRHRRRRCRRRRRRRAHLAPRTARIQRVGTGDYIWGCGIDEEERCVYCERCGYTREPVIVSGSRFRLPRRGEAASRSDALFGLRRAVEIYGDHAEYTTVHDAYLPAISQTRHYATREIRTRAYSRCEFQYHLLDQRYTRAARHAGDQEPGYLHAYLQHFVQPFILSHIRPSTPPLFWTRSPTFNGGIHERITTQHYYGVTSHHSQVSLLPR